MLSLTGLVQNTTIEERVALLEIQVAVIQDDLTEVEDDVTGLEVDLTELDENVDFLLDEQIIQDERLLELEQTSDQVVVELAETNADILSKRRNKHYIYGYHLFMDYILNLDLSLWISISE